MNKPVGGVQHATLLDNTSTLNLCIEG